MSDPNDNSGRRRPLSELTAGDLHDMIHSAIDRRIGPLRPGGLAGSHANSGPPGHANDGGHANFDPHSIPGGGTRVDLPVVAGVHVNSGPPGHANDGGHANFNPRTRPEANIRVLPGAIAGSHANSGPPGHANEPGHANFDPDHLGRDILITLPDGSKVSVPAKGPLKMTVRGFRITR